MLHGYFRNKCPYIKIVLAGTSEEEIEVLVDTGFNGSLTLPEHMAIKLGLEKTNAISISSIADGSSSPSIVYVGKAICDGVRVLNTIVDVQLDCKALLGMSLLNEFGLNLFVDLEANRVELDTSGKKFALRNLNPFL